MKKELTWRNNLRKEQVSSFRGQRVAATDINNGIKAERGVYKEGR